MTAVIARGVRRNAMRQDWEDGRDFYAISTPPEWIGGPYFSVRDLDVLRKIQVKKIVFVDDSTSGILFEVKL
jgi:hypothetical protein